MSVKEGSKAPDSKVTIKIPGAIYNRIAETIKGSGFDSVTDFIVYVLRDLVSTSPMVPPHKERDISELTKEEVEAIRKRLKSLGYL